MRDTILKKVKKFGKVHLGLGCYLRSSTPDKDIRSLNNATCQFWSILSLLTIEKIDTLVQNAGLMEDIEVVSSIYDSIYFHVRNSARVVKWLNDNLIPIMTKDFLKGIIVHNKAELECGYNWADTVPIPNGANIFQIKEAMAKAKSLIDKNS